MLGTIHVPAGTSCVPPLAGRCYLLSRHRRKAPDLQGQQREQQNGVLWTQRQSCRSSIVAKGTENMPEQPCTLANAVHQHCTQESAMGPKTTKHCLAEPCTLANAGHQHCTQESVLAPKTTKHCLGKRRSCVRGNRTGQTCMRTHAKCRWQQVHTLQHIPTMPQNADAQRSVKGVCVCV